MYEIINIYSDSENLLSMQFSFAINGKLDFFFLRVFVAEENSFMKDKQEYLSCQRTVRLGNSSKIGMFVSQTIS